MVMKQAVCLRQLAHRHEASGMLASNEPALAVTWGSTCRQKCYCCAFVTCVCCCCLQARGAAVFIEAALTTLLEQYLLGLVCPDEQQQRANQAAVAREASLALQGAVRVMHEHVSPAASCKQHSV
jgi:hypothetical protein